MPYENLHEWVQRNGPGYHPRIVIFSSWTQDKDLKKGNLTLLIIIINV